MSNDTFADTDGATEVQVGLSSCLYSDGSGYQWDPYYSETCLYNPSVYVDEGESVWPDPEWPSGGGGGFVSPCIGTQVDETQWWMLPSGLTNAEEVCVSSGGTTSISVAAGTGKEATFQSVPGVCAHDYPISECNFVEVYVYVDNYGPRPRVRTVVSLCDAGGCLVRDDRWTTL